MRKLSVLALVAAVLVSGSVFAAGLTKQADATFTPGVGGAAIGPTTTNNDDSCDIGTAPAATLLLPYFEVDLGTAGTGRTTVFSVTNVSPYAQIAHVVVWTDWSYPVLDFNLFLTGYDVAPINLYDVIARGFIGSPAFNTGIAANGVQPAGSPNARSGSTTGSGAAATPNQIAVQTTTGTNPNTGTQPFRTDTTAGFFGNPNFNQANVAANCAVGRLPGQLPTALAADVRSALSTGTPTQGATGCGSPSAQIGSNHGSNTAIGYLTIDVAATCGTGLPIDPTYFSSEILFDNVLIGDYQDVNQSTTAGNYAGGNPMVHIRAIPEGGAAGSIPAGVTNLPFTFYDRYTFGYADRRVDRRQPLPQAFAARWISGSTAAFDTTYKIWREGFTTNTAGPLAACADYANLNSNIPYTEIVRFDEHENAGVLGSVGGIVVSPPPIVPTQGLPETSRQPIAASIFPTVAGSTDAGGWTYFNLNNGGNATALANPGRFGGATPFSASRPGFTLPVGGSPVLAAAPFNRDVSQNWVILSMFAEGRYGVDQDANWLGNGCSAAFPVSSSGAATSALNRIAPAGGVLVCSPPNPPGTGGGTSTVASGAGQCTGSNVTP